MTDPVAEAAANLAKQHAEPGLIEEIKDGMHDLAEKVEHLIHPGASAPSATGEPATAVAADQSSPAATSDAVEPIQAEIPNVPEASTSGTPADSTPSPVVQDAPAPDVPAINSPTVELGNVAAVETASSLAESSTLSALTLPETSTASSESADLPNAAPAVVDQPVIAASVLDASGSDTQAVEPSVHESLLRKIIAVLDRDFNMFSGELKQLMTEAKTHL